MIRKFTAVIAAMLAFGLVGCGQVGLGDSSEIDPVFTTSVTYTKRTVHTTKTAVIIGEVDADDEDIDGGYTTTTTVTGSLENEEIFNPDSEVDEDMRSTQRTEAKTYYSLPEHNGTTAGAVTVSSPAVTTTVNGTIKLDGDETTTQAKTSAKTTTTSATTAFNASVLYTCTDSMRYSEKKSYKVVSDTTYLNLRFGPSKKYDIRLKIPDGTAIKGFGETVGTDGNVWVYTSYNGTCGWVMRELLE